MTTELEARAAAKALAILIESDEPVAYAAADALRAAGWQHVPEGHAVVQQAEIARLTERLEAAERERDAARAAALNEALDQLLPMIPVGAESDARRFIAALATGGPDDRT